MTGCKVSVSEPGKLRLDYIDKSRDEPPASLHVFYDTEILTPKFETMPISDNRLKGVWGNKITRVVLQANSAVDKDLWMLKISR